VDLGIKIRGKILDIKLKSQSTNMRPGEQKTYSFVSLKAQETWSLTPLPASFLQNLTKNLNTILLLRKENIMKYVNNFGIDEILSLSYLNRTKSRVIR
jgi:hypothetical protein